MPHSTADVGEVARNDPAEGRGRQIEEPLEGKMARSPSLRTVSTKQERIAKLAREMPDVALKTVSHHIDLDWLREAYRRTRKDGAAGVDGQTAEDYAEGLDAKLEALLSRAKSGDHYRAPPVRRVYIPKADGESQRGLGIPTFEDKLLQRAVVMALEPIYEQDFLDCSFGSRTGRSAHDAVRRIDTQLGRHGSKWLLEADIKGFFDAVNHQALVSILEQRVQDGVLLRLIGKWLKAGVWEDERVTRSSTGTPQGGVISPLLANIYLHEVLDKWFATEVKPRLRGEAELVRYVDDFVILFECEDDARRVWSVLPKRLGKYGLALHPGKTRLVRVGRPTRAIVKREERPKTFDFLGFSFYWAKSRKGRWILKEKTARDRYSRGLKAANEWCKRNRHLPLVEQHRLLCRKLWGHYAYYGITGNYRRMSSLRRQVIWTWYKWLCRRSNKSRRPKQWMCDLLRKLHFPEPKIIHSLSAPSQVRTFDPRSRMRESRTSGSVGAPGE